MIKSFIATILFSALLIMLLLFTYYDQVYTIEHFADAIFMIGITMFFMGLISVTNASRVFTGAGYAFKSIYTRRGTGNKTFYQYSAEKKKEKSLFSTPIFIVGLGYIIISVFLAIQIMG